MILRVVIIGLGIDLCHATGMGAEHSRPEEEAKSFRLADPGLKVELVAAEPNVASPVAITWDEHGSLFVAEMRDYPTGPASGRVRRLRDEDGDGYYESAITYADNLAFPNGVMPWRDGILVTAAPNIWFFKDSDGDGKADHKEVIFTGFSEGNQQLRVNGLFMGLDGWIYGANGRSDGEIRRPQGGAVVSIRGQDFRFHATSLEFQTVPGRSQFGHGEDDWGRRFLSWNTVIARHEVLRSQWFEKHTGLNGRSPLQDLTPLGDNGAVFPLTIPPMTFNRESTSHFNALAGLTVFRGNNLPSEYRGNLFVGETLRNLVHRRVLIPQGSSFVAMRHSREVNQEFLASSDPWFHPVNFATGPDGAFYIVDFYREWVEHPGFVPERLRESNDWRRGSDFGRIWRIKSIRSEPRDKQVWPGDLALSDLVRLLDHPNSWQRDTAQRLILQRGSQDASDELRRLLKVGREESQVKALWLLENLGLIDHSLLKRAMKSDRPRIRETAYAVVASRPLDSPKEWLPSPQNEADPHVRLKRALAHVRTQLDASDIKQFLINIAGQNDWERSSIRLLAAQDLKSWVQNAIKLGSRMDSLTLNELANDFGRAYPDLGRTFLISLWQQDRKGNSGGHWMAVWSGFLEGVGERPKTDEIDPLAWVKEPGYGPWRRQTFESAAVRASDPSVASSERAMAIRLYARLMDQENESQMVNWLVESQESVIQQACLESLQRETRVTLFDQTLKLWARLNLSARRSILDMLTRTPDRVRWLLDAVEHSQLSAAELDPSMRQTALAHAKGEDRTRAQKWLVNSVDADRDKVYRNLVRTVKPDGDLKRGEMTFERLCAGCHQFGGKGTAVGPDLTGIGTRGIEAVLLDVIDPSRQVAPDFKAYDISTKDGEILSGLIVKETSDSVTLRRANRPDTIVGRKTITEIRATSKSLMPDGLEAGLANEDLAALLLFLKVR